MEKYINFVKNILSGGKYVTLPLVVISFNLLIEKIENTVNDQSKRLNDQIPWTEDDDKLIRAFLAGRDKMLKHYKKTNWIYCVSLILDPKHKEETFDLQRRNL